MWKISVMGSLICLLEAGILKNSSPVCLLLTPFRTHSCHTYSLTTSGSALPVVLTIQPQKNCLYPLFELRSTSLKKANSYMLQIQPGGLVSLVVVSADVPAIANRQLDIDGKMTSITEI